MSLQAQTVPVTRLTSHRLHTEVITTPGTAPGREQGSRNPTSPHPQEQQALIFSVTQKTLTFQQQKMKKLAFKIFPTSSLYRDSLVFKSFLREINS